MNYFGCIIQQHPSTSVRDEAIECIPIPLSLMHIASSTMAALPSHLPAHGPHPVIRCTTFPYGRKGPCESKAFTLEL
jgi:hypothetical protein